MSSMAVSLLKHALQNSDVGRPFQGRQARLKASPYRFCDPHSREERHAERRQEQVHGQGEAPGRAYRRGVRGTRRPGGGIRAARLGDREQSARRRRKTGRRRLRQAGEPRADAQRRTQEPQRQLSLQNRCARADTARMFWWFKRGSDYVRYESRQIAEHAYELRVIDAGGSERVERFETERDLTDRQRELERGLLEEGWTGPHGWNL